MRVIECMGVLAFASLVVAISMPNLIQARRHGNETAAIGALKTIGTSTSIARERNGATFEARPENTWREAKGEDLRSTFSIDVDTASYTTARSYLERRLLPPPESVRVEELVNAFDYAYAEPTDARPFAVSSEVATCPWRRDHRLVRIALAGREVPRDERPAMNLVFLVDVSGSMQEPLKLPLVKQGLELLVNQLSDRDRVALVAYAGASGLVLPPTPGHRKRELEQAIARLEAGGSTNGSAGLQLAYETAASTFIQGGQNRVVLCTDGDWNVGITDRRELEELIARRARSGVFLSVLGFGMSRNDATCVRLADRGNGHYAFVDSLDEAKRVLVEKLSGTLVTIAKDVKVQVAWDPSSVRSFRLVGYEKRALENKDFADDKKDAGEIGAGHTVTAFYEVDATGGNLGTFALRWKRPDGEVSEEATYPLVDGGATFERATPDFRFASAVAAFGLLLRGSKEARDATLGWVVETATLAAGEDARRKELVALAKIAEELSREPRRAADDHLAELGRQGLVDGLLASGTKQGYKFRAYRHPDGLRWIAAADPAVPTTTGDRYFVTNQAGVMYYSTTGPFELTKDCSIPPGALPVGK